MELKELETKIQQILNNNTVKVDITEKFNEKRINLYFEYYRDGDTKINILSFVIKPYNRILIQDYYNRFCLVKDHSKYLEKMKELIDIAILCQKYDTENAIEKLVKEYVKEHINFNKKR